MRTLLLICIIGFSAKAELRHDYTPVNVTAGKLAGFQNAQEYRFPSKSAYWNGRPAAVSDSDSIVYQLTPTLTVVTKPLGTAKNNASVTFYNGPLLLYTVTVTQTSPISVCTFDLVLGTVKIEKGMRITLQIPSSLQSGSIFLQATFSDLNVPSTSISAMIATWTL